MNRSRYYKIINNPKLVRDTDSSAILSTDVDGFNAFKKARIFQQKTQKMLEEFDGVKSDVSEIKSLLKILVNKDNADLDAVNSHSV